MPGKVQHTAQPPCAESEEKQTTLFLGLEKENMLELNVSALQSGDKWLLTAAKAALEREPEQVKIPRYDDEIAVWSGMLERRCQSQHHTSNSDLLNYEFLEKKLFHARVYLSQCLLLGLMCCIYWKTTE